MTHPDQPIYRNDDAVRDPEDRRVDECDRAEVREKMLDKTIADTFPASDPPSTNPAPTEDPFVPAAEERCAVAQDSHSRTGPKRKAS
jgi:hypothetical protein